MKHFSQSPFLIMAILTKFASQISFQFGHESLRPQTITSYSQSDSFEDVIKSGILKL
jgi:hypothetical protein